MKNIFSLAVTTLLLPSLWTSLALAEPTELTERAEKSLRPPFLSTRLSCTTDGDLFFGERGEARGSAAISATGTIQFTLSRLAPHTELMCTLLCVGIGGAPQTIFQEQCTANAQGRLKATFPRGAHPSAIGGGCLMPTLAAGNDSVACVPGYGRKNLNPPKR
jgi:hypothetical protein